MENIINVLIEKTKNGYSAFSNEVAGVTYADSIQEIKENFTEVIDMYIDYLNEQEDYNKAIILNNSEIKYYLEL